jgi:hypothetical protein
MIHLERPQASKDLISPLQKELSTLSGGFFNCVSAEMLSFNEGWTAEINTISSRKGFITGPYSQAVWSNLQLSP